MEKLQTIVVILLVVAIVFSIASVVMNVYLANMKPVSAKVVNAQIEPQQNNGNLAISILPASGQSEGETK